jgi:gluconokinase
VNGDALVKRDPGAIRPDRAERPLVLAIDIGSSSVRAALYDRLGRTLRDCAVQVPYAWDLGQGGSVRLSHVTLLDLVAQAIDDLVASIGAIARDVVAGGISCLFHSIVGMDGAGRPVTPVLSWADTTSAGDAATLRERVDAGAIHALTGAPVHASHWPARILRLRGEHAGIRRWAGLPDLITESLTGRTVMSRCMASGTGLLDRAAGTWSEPLLGQLDVDPDQLTPIVDDTTPVGRLTDAAAGRWPSLAHVVWFAAWGDGACGNVGLAASGVGTAALMVGTSGALRALVDDPGPALVPGLFGYRLGDGALVGGQLSEGGGLLTWTSALLRQPAARLERAAATLDPAAHGLTVLPYTFGERGPGYHDDASGAIVGLTPGTDGAAVYRATIESIAFAFASIDDRLTRVLGGATPAIIASGGALAHSPLLTQVLADALGRDIAVAPDLEGSCRGAALLALQGTGHLTDLEAAPVPPVRMFRFDRARAAIYRSARIRQEALYATLLGPRTMVEGSSR